jgi:hypothetical protein
VKYDRKAAREELKQNIQQEKLTLKQIFQEEFGRGENDSSSLIKEEKQTNNNFEIEWEEDKENKSEEKETIRNNEQKFVIEWEEDTLL